MLYCIILRINLLTYLLTSFESYNPHATDLVGVVGDTQSNINQWFLANRLCLNNSKAQYINFSLRVQPPQATVSFPGVQLDGKLT